MKTPLLLKNSVIAIGGLLISASLLTACKEPAVSSQDDTIAGTQQSQPSEIDLLEKQTGVIYFKKDLILKDEKGTEALIRFASVDKNVLDDQLAKFDYKIKAVYNIDTQGTSNSKFIDQNTEAPQRQEVTSLIIEPLSVKLPNNAKGYTLEVTSHKTGISNPNARVDPDPAYHYEVLSPFYAQQGFLNVSRSWVEHTLDVKLTWSGSWRRDSEPRYFTSGGYVFYSQNKASNVRYDYPAEQYMGSGFTHNIYLQYSYRYKAHIFTNDQSNWGFTWQP